MMIMRGMGDVTTDTGDSSTMQDITNGLRDLLTVYNQQMIMKTNMQRAQQGLPPINTAAYAPTYNVGLSPDAKNLLMIGGGLLLVVFLLSGRKS